MDLPVVLTHLHDMFDISQLRKYVLDINHAIVIEPIDITKDQVYEECSF